MVRIGVDVEGFIVGLSVGVVGSVLEVSGHVQEVADFEVCANTVIVMSSPCFLNSRVMSFLVRSDCGPLVFPKSTSPSSL